MRKPDFVSKRILFVSLAIVFFVAGAAQAAVDIPSGIRFGAGSEVSFKVVDSFNAQIVDKFGQPLELIPKDKLLQNTDVIVDAAGSLILEVTGSAGERGYLQVLQNSSIRVERSDILLSSGEIVLEKVEDCELFGGVFRIPSPRAPLSGYLYFRDGNSFFSTSYREDPLKVVAPSGGEVLLMPGHTIKSSPGMQVKLHNIVPSDASTAMRSLAWAVRNLRYSVKPRALIRITGSKGAKLAVESITGLQYRTIVVGDELSPGSVSSPLIIDLVDEESVLKFDYLNPNHNESREYFGLRTLKIYEDNMRMRGVE